MNLFNTDNVCELLDAWPGPAWELQAQRCCRLPGIVFPGLHPTCIHSGSLCIMLFTRSQLLTCHCGRWWD